LSVKEHGVLNGVVILGRRARGRGIAVVGYGGGLVLSSDTHGSSIALERGVGSLLLRGCNTLKGSGADLRRSSRSARAAASRSPAAAAGGRVPAIARARAAEDESGWEPGLVIR
jgi:predicted small secreted protein